MTKDRLITMATAAMALIATAGWIREQPRVEAFAPADETTIASAFQSVQPVAAKAAVPVRQTARVQPTPSRVYEDTRRAPVQNERSKKESAMIIGGGAATGAAIGGLAGGGKGAAIGAISGGAAGVVYDRMTHKKSAPETREPSRSKTESAAIIGGGAAAGAAIGGLAGGGKGAAIGAVSGGAAGLVYDQITRNK